MYENKQVAATDAEIARNNRLQLLVDIHGRRQKTATAAVANTTKVKRSKKMGKQNGTCEQCGKQDARLISHFGKMACPSCVAMRGFVKAKPTFVLEALQEFHEDKYLPDLRESGEELAAVKKELLIALDLSEERQRVCTLLEDCMYGLLERGGVDNENMDGYAVEELCTLLKQHVGGLRLAAQATGEIDQMAGDVPTNEYVLALDQAYDIEHAWCLHGHFDPDPLLLGALAAEIGLEREDQVFSAQEVIEAVAHITQALASSEQRRLELKTANQEQRRQLNQLTSNMTAASIVDQVEAADEQETLLLDAALAALRGDGAVVADILQQMRRRSHAL